MQFRTSGNKDGIGGGGGGDAMMGNEHRKVRKGGEDGRRTGGNLSRNQNRE